MNVEVRAVARTDGSAAQFLTVDLTQAPVPERQFVSNTADLVFEDSTAMFLFGQKKIKSEELRALLILSMPLNKLAEMLKSVEGMASPGLESILKQEEIQMQQLVPISREPAQTVPLVANLCGVAISGRETCIDFFHISAFAVLDLKKSQQKLALNPIVRLHVSTGLFAALVVRMKELCSTFVSKEMDHG